MFNATTPSSQSFATDKAFYQFDALCGHPELTIDGIAFWLATATCVIPLLLAHLALTA